jgi:MFS family permease
MSHVKRSGAGATLAAAFAAPVVASLANAIPGSLNGVFQAYFQTQGAQLTWITAAFMIPVVVFELTFGALGDIYGRKRLMYLGSLLLIAGGIVSALAANVYVMWAGACLDGLGAGILYPTSLAMVSAVTRTPAARSRGIAVWAGFLSLGGAICPLIAGALSDAGWWQGGYALIAAAALLTLLLSLRAQDSSAPEGRRLDISGQVTFAVGLIAVLWATVQGSEDGYGKPQIIIGYVVGGILLAAFGYLETRVASPLLQLSLFRNRSFSVVGLVTVIGVFGFLVYCFSTSVWLGVLQHQNGVDIGIVWIVMQAPSFVFSPLVGRLLHRVSPQWILTLGFALISVGGFITSGFGAEDFHWTKFFLPAAFIGVGWALTIASISAVSISSVPRQLAGMGSATTNLLRDLGFALGPVIGGAIAFGKANSALVPGLAALHLPPQAAGPVAGIARAGGAVALNSVPALPAAVHDVALSALGAGFHLAYLVAAVASAVAALVTLVGLIGAKSRHLSDEEPATEPHTLAEPV